MSKKVAVISAVGITAVAIFLIIAANLGWIGSGNAETTTTAAVPQTITEITTSSTTTTTTTTKSTISTTKSDKPTKVMDPFDGTGRIVYLTFDDGPGKYTDQLLTILKKYNVKATFFVTNQFPAYQNCIAREAAEGHTVAIHTYSHNYKTVYSSTEGYWKDVNKMNDIIQKQTGKKSNLIRFPGGASNTVSRRYSDGIMTKLSKQVEEKGYYYTDWSVDSRDAENKSTESIVKNVVYGMKHNEVSVVLQHDIKKNTIDAMEQIIKWGLKNGYTFKAMTPGVDMVHQKINN